MQTANDLKKIQRVERILNLYPNVPNKNEIIYKCTLKNDLERGFQLIFTMNGNKKYIYLIDLYHLTIPSRLNIKKSNFNLQLEYFSKTKYKKDIKDILFKSKELIPQ